MKAPEPAFPMSSEILGPIKGYTSLIQDDNPPGSNTRWWADKLMRDVEQLESALVSMDMLRFDALPETETTWRRVVTSAIEAVGRTTVLPRLEVFNGVEAPFTTSEGLLVRALFQVVRNAAEASGPDGCVSIRVDEHGVGNDGTVEHVVTVEDNGPGIPRGDLELICRPFTTTRQGHAGLGLPYVQAVANSHGIGVRIESGTGGGTVVTMRMRIKGGRL